MTGVALIFGYALLGSTWTVMKTEGETQEWARKMAFYVLTYVGFFMGLVSLWVPFINDEIFQRWFSLPNLIYLSPIPLLTLTLGLSLIISLMKKRNNPFLSFNLSFFFGVCGTCNQSMALDCSLPDFSKNRRCRSKVLVAHAHWR